MALETAYNNSKINYVDSVCNFRDVSISDIKDKFDLVVVNILARTIISMAEDIKRLTRPGGFIILSGIISEKIELISECFKKIGFNIIEISEEEGWYALVAERN